MSWSIQQVARLSGVTARTLRHYDDIGLLRPARVGANGYRYYEQAELLRLQQILLLRELGVDLPTIAAVVDGARDPIEALRGHHRRLVEQGAWLDRLVRTVAATIAHLERGTDMPAEELFAGFRFTREVLADLEARTIEQTGQTEQPHFAEIKRRTEDWTDDQFRQVEREGAEIELRLLALLRDGVASRKLWTPDRESYAGLGKAFATAPGLRAHLDARDPRLADYMRDAMVAYADTRMS